MEPHMVHYGPFVHLALHTFSCLGWGPLIVHFVVIFLIGEYCEHIVSLFVCSFCRSFMGFLSSIWHPHFDCLWVLFLSCHLVLLLFSLEWWWCALILFQIKHVTPFIPPLGFDLGLLVWENHLGLRFESHLLECDSVAISLLGLWCHCKKKKKKNWYSFHIYLG